MKPIISLILLAILALPLVGYGQEDSGWPREKSGPNGKMTIYPPQVDSWDYSVLKARVAVVARPTGGKDMPGALELEADTVVDKEQRLVGLCNMKVTASRFPGASSEDAEQIQNLVNQYLAEKSITLSLDRLLAAVQKEEFSARNVPTKNDAPKIFVSKTPAILVLIDGEPVMSQVPGTPLMYVVNTNWDMILETTSSQAYLLNGDMWLTTKDPKNPDWKLVTAGLPEPFKSIPDDPNWLEVKKRIPPPKSDATTAPKVFLSGEPAELILFEGEPQMTPIKGTKLMYMKNTESDLLFYTPDSTYYYLVSGRWFKATSLEGPWTFAGNQVPEDFGRIPQDHEMARLLASVPGTDEAKDAVMMATVPTFAKADRDQTTLSVTYDGEPNMQPIEGTNVKYAVNTVFNVLQVGADYYCCYEGIWFKAASPLGPWTVTENVPTEIFSIPPSSSMYAVTYVQPYEATPTDVTYGYTAGYTGSYICDGTVVYGTGYYYPPYVSNALVWGLGLATTYAVQSELIDDWEDFWDDHHYDPYYPWRPAYYPYPYSYGAGAYYNPYSGTWGRGAYAYGPYGGIAGRATYNPYTGRYSRGYAAYGPYRSGWGGQVYNPRTGVYAATRQGSNPYANWGTSVVQHGDDWLRTAHYNDTRAFRTSEGAKGAWGDEHGIVVDNDGNRYIKGDDGWNKWDGREWKQSEAPRDQGRRDAYDKSLMQQEGKVARNAKDNMFVGNDGNVYRGEGNNWQKLGENGKWENFKDAAGVAGAAGVGAMAGVAAGKGFGAKRDQLPTAGTGTQPGLGPKTGDRMTQPPGKSQLPSGGQIAQRPATSQQPIASQRPVTSQRTPNQPVTQQLNRDSQVRAQGNYNTQKYQNMPSKTSQPRTQSVQRSSSSYGSSSRSASSSRSSYSGGSRSAPSPSRSSGASRSAPRSGGASRGGGRGGRR